MGGRDSSCTSSGVSFLMSNVVQVTKSANILAFCGGGPVLFLLDPKIGRYLRWGCHVIVFTIGHRGYYLGGGLSEVSLVPWGCWTRCPSELSRVFISGDGDSGLLGWGVFYINFINFILSMGSWLLRGFLLGFASSFTFQFL